MNKYNTPYNIFIYFRINEAEENFGRVEAEFKDKQLKLQTTVGQQMKLVEHLQSQIEVPVKKRTVCSIYFFGKGLFFIFWDKK